MLVHPRDGSGAERSQLAPDDEISPPHCLWTYVAGQLTAAGQCGAFVGAGSALQIVAESGHTAPGMFQSAVQSWQRPALYTIMSGLHCFISH